MQDRKDQLLKGIVDLYVAAHEPVGSQALLTHLGLDISSATVRNDIKHLEEQGFVVQPHTSAGRIPTARAYRRYVERFLQPTVPQSMVAAIRKKPLGEPEHVVKNFARTLAEGVRESVFLVLTNHQSYYTGLAHLFSQPEFADQGTLQNVTALLDRFDDIVEHLFALVADKDMHVHIGPGNPFGAECAIMYIPFSLTRTNKSLLGILGPMRMDYNVMIGTMRAAKEYCDRISAYAR